jgi:Ca2+-binding RTX toxin-like protein
MDAQGNYTYVSWKEPGVPSDRIVENGQYAALKDGTLYTQNNLWGGAVYVTKDVFQVKITDPHGASVIQNIEVPHFGPYLPPTPSGGGGKKPISVDLGGDGFDFINVDDSNVFFDITGDGWKRRTAWVGASDGLLAFDSDGNGKIETSGEISFVGYKDGAQSDLEGLSAFDTNSDGIFSALDAKWNQFGVWQDANSDGITDEGEFKRLSEMGVSSISLTSDGKFSIINEQTLHGVGSMQMEDGSVMAIADVTLEYTNETEVHNSDGTTSSVVASPFSPDGEEINGTEDKDLILGKNGNNIINAFGGDDVIFEDGGNDVIDAGEGNDIVYAGADNDIVFAQGGDDLVYGGLGDDMIFGGDGHDAIFADGGNDVVFAGSGNDMVTGGYGNDVISGDDGDDMLYGEGGNDALFGRDGNDELFGTEGYDLLNGGAGDDLLDGGSEADEMVGGTGDDTYVVDNTADIVTEAANEGSDTVIASIDYTLAATLENLTLSGDAINGTGNDTDNRLIGNANNNRLEAKGGNDTLNGGAGADTLIGGSGDDLYIVDNVGDTVIEALNEGIDTVRASVSYTLSDNVEHLTLTGSASISATGNVLDNMLVGNSGNNILDGGMGIDTMIGGKGDDLYVVDNTEDIVIEYAGEGVDTVRSSVTRTLEDTIENLVLSGSNAIDGTGNSMSNILIGNDAANTLDAKAGSDAMAGYGGDDTYIVDNVGDTVYESVDAGDDHVIASVTYTLSDNVERLTLVGTDAIDATGNNLDNVLIGNSADNVLDGKSGADTMIGKAGNDTYVVDNIGDIVVETADNGIDTIISSISYVLPEHVENITLSGSDNISATGNELNNMIIGNSANNVLDGKAGMDTMSGGAGDDTYYVDTIGDTVLENIAEGIDTIKTTVTYTASANVERLELIGTENIDGYGNELDNTLIGNSGNNRLDGQSGMDAMSGGAGDDTYIVDNIGDTVTEGLNEGDDHVISSVTYTLSDNVERLTLVGTDTIDGTGNVLDNTLIGNSANNILDGKEGGDTMIGGDGDDNYFVDSSLDSVYENVNEGIDTIYSSVSYVLPENVENLILIGNGNINAGGNRLDNILIGNGSNNMLEGGIGNDTLIGGLGNDTFVVNMGDGLDSIIDDGGEDTVRFTDSFTLDNVALRVVDVAGTLTAQVRVLNAGGCEQADQGFDFAITKDTLGNYVSPIEHFTFSDGSCKTFDDLLIKTQITYGTNKQTTIVTGRNDDIIYATGKSNFIQSGTGNDIVYAASGGDTIYGQGGNDTLYGNTGNDTFDGGCGTDILFGGNGDDVLVDMLGNNALLGGSQNDTIMSGNGNDFIAGGLHDDILNGGGGYNVFAFNRGEGYDTILPAAGAHNTLSLNDVNYRDISMRKTGNDLTLDIGANSKVTFKSWYTDAANQNFDTLQIVSLTVDTFDFHALVDAFDMARTSNPKLSSWGAMNELLNAHLNTSNSMALGGDLAFNYAKDGDLSNVSLIATQNALNNPSFGIAAQALTPKAL